MKQVTFAVLGYGARGSNYSNTIFNHSDKMRVVAVCEKNLQKLEIASKKLNLPQCDCYQNVTQFFSNGKLADVLIVSTQDRAHYDFTMKALDLGYDILLEKPISVSEAECRAIAKKAMRLNRKVIICHVLRYTPFYQTIQQILQSGELGEVVTISQTENVGYWHQAHSFVRGNWSNSQKSSPMILQKCCHDLDIIKWLMGGRCEKVSSFGSLSFFVEKNKPASAKQYCFECGLREECPYDAISFYNEKEDWRNMTGQYFAAGDEASITECFSRKDNPYARCVFSCDNDVVDHQVVNLLFESGKTAQLTMTAFSKDFRRTIKVHCTNGEIVGDIAENIITISPFKKPQRVIDIRTLCDDLTNHGGGDKRMILEVYDYIAGNGQGNGLTSISQSLESHLMAFAAEESRKRGGKVICIH